MRIERSVNVAEYVCRGGPPQLAHTINKAAHRIDIETPFGEPPWDLLLRWIRMACARSAFLVFVVASGCNVYGPTLLVGDGGGVDAPAEACSTQCGGKCTDTQTDKNNCGACGTTCETGCSGGMCTPTLLASALGAPHGILLNGTQLYVANNGSINVQSMSKIDGTGLKNYASSQLFPDRLAASPSTLYWTNNANSPHPAGGRVEEEAFDGSFCNTQTQSLFCYIADDLPSPYGIAVQGGTIFLTTTASTNNAGAGCAPDSWVSSVLSCSASFGCATTACATSGGPGVIASGQTKLGSVAADATNVYWADTGAHTVRFCPQPNCGVPQTFAQLGSTASPFDVVSDGKTVYFTDRSGSTLYACPTTGCAGKPTVLASNIDDPLLIAVDSAAVFVTSYAKGAPGKGSIVGCALPCQNGVTTIANGLKAPYGIAVDSGYVYWSEEGSAGSPASIDGAVKKIKRPF